MTHPTCVCGGHPGCELDSAAERPEAFGAAGGGGRDEHPDPAGGQSARCAHRVCRRRRRHGAGWVLQHPGRRRPARRRPRRRPWRRRTLPSPPPARLETHPASGWPLRRDVAVGGGVVLAASSERVVVLTHPAADQFEAFDARCPHAGCRMFQIASNIITCNCHKSTFDAATGDRLGGPAPTGLTPVKSPWRAMRSTSRSTGAAFRPPTGEIPNEPGVYRFRDADGRVIYVGKAKSLRSRLTSYFQDPVGLHQRTRTMVATARSVDWVVVATEVEALSLEYSWIKEYDPRFNVRYRDDKSYPFLAVTLGEEFPRALVMRGEKRPGVRYFGPYAHAWAIRETVDQLLRVFPIRTCSRGVFQRAHTSGRPCLLGYIDKCSAPCVGSISAGGPSRDRRGLLRLHGRRLRRVPQGPRGPDGAGGGRAGLREGGPAARRPVRPPAGAGAQHGGAARPHRCRHRRPGQRRAGGVAAGVPCARRADPRGAWVHRRAGRRRRRGAA